MSRTFPLFNKISQKWRAVIRRISPILSHVSAPFFVVIAHCPIRSYDILVAPKKDQVKFEGLDEKFFWQTVDGAITKAENYISMLQNSVANSKCYQAQTMAVMKGGISRTRQRRVPTRQRRVPTRRIPEVEGLQQNSPESFIIGSQPNGSSIIGSQSKVPRRRISEVEGLQQNSPEVSITEKQRGAKRRRTPEAEGSQQSNSNVHVELSCEQGSLTENFFKRITESLTDYGRSEGGNLHVALHGSPELQSFLEKHHDNPFNCPT